MFSSLLTDTDINWFFLFAAPALAGWGEVGGDCVIVGPLSLIPPRGFCSDLLTEEVEPLIYIPFYFEFGLKFSHYGTVPEPTLSMILLTSTVIAPNVVNIFA